MPTLKLRGDTDDIAPLEILLAEFSKVLKKYFKIREWQLGPRQVCFILANRYGQECRVFAPDKEELHLDISVIAAVDELRADGILVMEQYRPGVEKLDALFKARGKTLH